MKFINFVVVKIAVCYAAGIVIAYFVGEVSFFMLKWLLPLFLILLVIWIWERPKLKPGVLFGIITYCVIFSIGFANYQAKQPQHSKRHFSQFTSGSTSEVLQLKITQILKPNAYNHKYLADVIQINGRVVQGTLLLSTERDSTNTIRNIDDLLLLSSEIDALPTPMNPYQFDYAKYLNQLGVYHQIRIKTEHIHRITKGSSTIKGFSEKIREYLILKLSETPIKAPQRSIIQALLLGQRADIEKDLYSQYAAAGALHILAVSGLHVGILYLIFARLLSPFERLKHGKIIKQFVLVIGLWAFALLAGLSPSVVRAVTMFSFFALAGMLNRPTNSFNTLWLSFFVLLLVNPNWLFHVGFQLSYAAVFAILWIQPKLYAIYIPRFYLDKLFWGIITVTLAAQIGIAPLSLYYFHQFPGLFFVTNLVILPFMGILLSLGLLVLLLATVDLLPYWLAIGYDWLIMQLNAFIGWVASQEAYLFENVAFSFGMLLSTYTVLVMLILFWTQRNKSYLVGIKGALVLYLVVSVSEKIDRQHEELILFHQTGISLLGYQTDGNFKLFQGDSLDYSKRFPIKGYVIGKGISKVTSELAPHFFSYRDKRILRLDSLGVYPSEEIDILLLTHSPKVHLERLIDSLQPSLIIADGSNYRSYVNRWEVTCKQRNVLFHATAIKGAFSFNLF